MSYLEENDFSEQNTVSVPNPYVYQTLQSAIGKHVVIGVASGLCGFTTLRQKTCINRV